MCCRKPPPWNLFCPRDADRRGIGTEGTDFVRNLCDLVEFRRRQDDVGTFFGLLQRNRLTDTAARSRDDCSSWFLFGSLILRSGHSDP
jgi:hypothetical protein